MRKLYFLVPGTGGKFRCGGLFAELKALSLARQVCDSEVVTYRQREPDQLFLDDVLRQKKLDDVIFILSWGFDVAKLATRLASYNVVYHAHSAGYGFKLPASIPVLCVSRNTLGYWGQQSPHSLIYYLPNEISPEFQNLHKQRDIDVLVQTRKSSQYLIQQLIPALRQKCNVFVVDSFIEDLPGLFNQAKVYLYDSAEYWAQQGVTEGFGLQPMEAIASGCQIFSSLNGGLSDYLDPGFNCHKIAGYSLKYDLQRILKVLESWSPAVVSEEFLAEYRADNIVKRLNIVLEEINDFFNHKENNPGNIESLTNIRLLQLRSQKIFAKVKQKFLG